MKKNCLIKIKPITELLSCQIEDIYSILSELTLEEIEILYLQYGENFDKEKTKPLSSTDSLKLYKYIIPKMKDLLKRKREKQTSNLSLDEIHPLEKEKPMINIAPDLDIEEEEYKLLLSLIKSNLFKEINESHSIEETLIITIEITEIDISRETIAKILNIPVLKVIELTKKALDEYKEIASSDRNNEPLSRKRQI